MSQIIIQYLLSETGRRAALAAGTTATELQTLAMDSTVPEWTKALDLVEVDAEGAGRIRVGFRVLSNRIHGVPYLRPSVNSWEKEDGPIALQEEVAFHFDAPQSVGDLLEWEARRRAEVPAFIAQQKERKERSDREKAQKALQERREKAIRWVDGPDARHGDLPEVAALISLLVEGGDPGELSDYHGSYGPIDKALKAIQEKSGLLARERFLADLTEAERALAVAHPCWGEWDWKEKAEKAVQDHRAAEEAAAWIEEHGSNRLRRCLAEGIECMAAYRDERLARERPFWRWESTVAGEASEPRNPTEEAFALLDRARESDPEAQLVRWEVEHEHNESCDGDCPKYDMVGYAATAEFLGREIVFLK